jgi:uncharacterized protein (TIGR03435 family)
MSIGNARSHAKTASISHRQIMVIGPMVVGLMIFHPILAQSQAGPQLTFEVASVKPSQPGGDQPNFAGSRNGRFAITNMPLRLIIQNTYDVSALQLLGGPGWIDTERYDIVAKAEGDGPFNGVQLRSMLRALLADRFKLTLHREAKELLEYALIVGKGGPKIRESAPAEPGGQSGIRSGIGQLTGVKASIGLLASTLSGPLGRSVVDKTGLKGVYDFVVTFAPNDSLAVSSEDGGQPRPATEGTRASIFTAVEEQLGLRLESTKGSVEAIVIDSVGRTSGN